MEWVSIKYSVILFWLILLAVQMPDCSGCLEKERLGLIQIKAYFSLNGADEAALDSWVDDKAANCCAWELVKCNTLTGHIAELSLNGFSADGDWFLNGSLFLPFDELRSLDLSDNSFEGFVEEKGLCEMKNLEELDLSSNEFNGDLPECLGNLSNLRILDLTHNMLSGHLPSFIVNLTSLEYLSFLENDIQGSFSLRTLANHSKLEVLHFPSRSNQLQVETENHQWLPTFQLKSLILRRCNLNMNSGRTIPSFLMFQNNLKYVDLSHNNMVGTFPSWLMHNNSGLEVLTLKNNLFTGNINLSSPILEMRFLDISSNKMSGLLAKDIGLLLPSVTVLSLYMNSFEGNIPSSIGEMKQIWSLDLSHNHFRGKIPEQLATNCTSLSYLRLSNNFLQGPIIPKSVRWTELASLYLNNNNFSGKLEEELGNITSLSIIDISNNSIAGQIPNAIGSCSSLKLILMTENQLEGQVPNGLLDLKRLEILDLSRNKLSSFAPDLNLTSLRFLYLQKNAFSGSIPSMLSKSSKLEVLDLTDNKFSGSIPLWIRNLSTLRVLLLGKNNFNGHIPIELCQIKSFSILDLSHNKLEGSVPSCIANMSFQFAGYADYDQSFKESTAIAIAGEINFSDIYSKASVQLNDEFTMNIFNEEVQVEVEFRTKSNYYTYGGKILGYMTGLDLSSNQLSGTIPPQIGYLYRIRALNLSHNFFIGSMPNTFSNLSLIESLDLSYNNLTGEIPHELSQLHFLAIFNVSYNNLFGIPPSSGQFANFDENNYRGNPHLCGPLLRSCEDNTPPSPVSQLKSKESAIDMVAFLWTFVGAYVTFFLGLVLVLCINVQWRLAWFRLLDRIVLFIDIQCHLAWFRFVDRFVPSCFLQY
ncbi:hypothetical protein L6164_005852 [Bauhinia variegata]|uniref:Uncharacterized protein n=1 Tax=Bauhinia variegata TaxID=167791 RepID=A0ACB9PSL2_BAUVA|nr:hypothetical protein L6164_005852 [Bauhinia variegata]